MKPKLLIVEDERLLRELLVTQCRKAGYTVFEASNGLAALQLIEPTRPDLILSDVTMPHCTGIELLERIRARGKTIPDFIFMTGIYDLSLPELYAKGALGVIYKPFVYTDVLKMLEICLVPKEIRWQPFQESLSEIEEGYVRAGKKLEPVRAASLGAVGMSIHLKSASFRVGTSIEFNVDCQIPNHNFHLKGRGIVRWVKGDGIGVEFTFLHPDSLAAVLKYIGRTRHLPPIPDLGS